MNVHFLFVGILAALCGLTHAQALPQNVPLPQDLKVAAPDESLPPEVKRFSGKWVGVWDARLDHVLVVEEIASAERVTVVYAYGSNQYVARPGFRRLRGKINSGVLTFTLRNGAVVTYDFTPNGELKAEYERPGELLRATMKRVRE